MHNNQFLTDYREILSHDSFTNAPNLRDYSGDQTFEDFSEIKKSKNRPQFHSADIKRMTDFNIKRIAFEHNSKKMFKNQQKFKEIELKVLRSSGIGAKFRVFSRTLNDIGGLLPKKYSQDRAILTLPVSKRNDMRGTRKGRTSFESRKERMKETRNDSFYNNEKYKRKSFILGDDYTPYDTLGDAKANWRCHDRRKPTGKNTAKNYHKKNYFSKRRRLSRPNGCHSFDLGHNMRSDSNFGFSPEKHNNRAKKVYMPFVYKKWKNRRLYRHRMGSDMSKTSDLFETDKKFSPKKRVRGNPDHCKSRKMVIQGNSLDRII